MARTQLNFFVGLPCFFGISTVFSDVLKYDPFFGMAFCVPAKGAGEQVETEGASSEGDHLASGPSRQRFLTHEPARSERQIDLYGGAVE